MKSKSHRLPARRFIAAIMMALAVATAVFSFTVKSNADTPTDKNTSPIKSTTQTDDAANPPAKLTPWKSFARPKTPDNPQIDYRQFQKLTADNESYRESRKVSTKDFLRMAKEKDTVILDTRSKKAFDEAHVRGAVHLNFSDFTEDKLAKVFPNKNTRILIYCNNNFVGQEKVPALALKSAPLALNIPTFVNLVGYGYKNVYELGETVKVDGGALPLEGTVIKAPEIKQSVDALLKNGFTVPVRFDGC